MIYVSGAHRDTFAGDAPDPVGKLHVLCCPLWVWEPMRTAATNTSVLLG